MGHSICDILGMVGPIDRNKKEMSQLNAILTSILTLTFELEFSSSNCISGIGGLIVMEQKGGGR